MSSNIHIGCLINNCFIIGSDIEGEELKNKITEVLLSVLNLTAENQLSAEDISPLHSDDQKNQENKKDNN